MSEVRILHRVTPADIIQLFPPDLWGLSLTSSWLVNLKQTWAYQLWRSHHNKTTPQRDMPPRAPRGSSKQRLELPGRKRTNDPLPSNNRAYHISSQPCDKYKIGPGAKCVCKQSEMTVKQKCNLHRTNTSGTALALTSSATDKLVPRSQCGHQGNQTGRLGLSLTYRNVLEP